MKKYILLPIALLIYLVVIAIYAYPTRNPGLSFTQYYITLGISAIIILLLSFFLKKKDENRRKKK